MSLHALGLNHTTAPLQMREKVTFAPDRICDALRDLTNGGRVKEAAILSTCNRTEIYFCGGEPLSVARWMEQVHALPERSLGPHTYALSQQEAVAQAFRDP
jgi:glutamyl-tRNA reductase